MTDAATTGRPGPAGPPTHGDPDGRSVTLPRMSKATTITKLTPDEAGRALYIDFEGQIGQPPVLLGYTRRSKPHQMERVRHLVTDAAFEPLAQADGIELLPLADAVERILQRAESKGRLIVAWSEHELEIVERFCPEKLDRLRARYVNARKLAVSWRWACHDGDRPKSNALADYLSLIGHSVPEGAGRDRTGTTIARVRKALAKGQGIAGLTEDQRRRWVDLREHNRHDCVGMRKICLLAAREVAARAEARERSRVAPVRSTAPSALT